MMIKQNQIKTIVVTGDIAIDWNLMADVLRGDETLVSAHSGFSRICGQVGGVSLLVKLLSQVVKMTNILQQDKSLQWQLRQVELPKDELHPDDEKFSQSIVSWIKFPENKKAKEKTIWRVKEFLGVEKVDKSSTEKNNILSIIDDVADADIVVLDDADLGFRDNMKLWPKAIREPDNNKKPVVILKMSEPLAQGNLWECLHNNFADSLIVIVSVDNLRKAEVQISRELSWERTAQDTANELIYNPAINSLANCKNVVITFKNAGAILFSNDEKSKYNKGITKIPKCELFFDPKVIEGMWEQEYEGGMLGYHTCMAAAITRQFLLQSPDLGNGIREGLSAMRMLHKKGYEEIVNCKGHRIISFPTALICEELFSGAQNVFSKTSVRYPKPPNHYNTSSDIDCNNAAYEVWTILKEQIDINLNKLAYDIVEQGGEVALKDVPLGKFEKMLTVDRLETEGFRSIRTLVNEYCAKKQPEKPLSIAVFGPPGSGKSFGVKQIASSLSYEIEDITFNLSQMKSSDELISAYHQIRDKVLKGVIPLVFWDEFDSKLDNAELGWLRYFLSPMQDGEFLEGQLRHPIGRAIFVFAGGTCHSFHKFIQHSLQSFIESKGPDFVSRLRGYVDILGANPPETGEKYDSYFIIRRAILLRSVLERSAPASIFYNKGGIKMLSIDRGVLRALLLVKEYYHGVRSVEAIVNMSMLTGRNKFERSSLPSAAQLNVHVSGDEFLSLANTIVLEGQILERLAEASHIVFCKGLENQEYVFGDTRCHIAPNKTHPLFKPYSEIPEYYKESNRENVRDIPAKLASIGCVMTLKSKNNVSYELNMDDIEILSELEHDRYMRHAVKNGWHYEAGKVKAFPVDPTLLPWHKMTQEELDIHYPDIAKAIGLEELPEDEKKKDKECIEKIPEMLVIVGYIVEKLEK